VTCRASIALPPSAVVKDRLVDVSRADSPATVIGEQVIKTAGRQVPLAFEIAYDPKRIEERFTYSVQVRIEDENGRLRFISDRHYPVLTSGAGRYVDLLLIAAAAPAPR
jgi:putative lipoprotein